MTYDEPVVITNKKTGTFESLQDFRQQQLDEKQVRKLKDLPKAKYVNGILYVGPDEFDKVGENLHKYDEQLMNKAKREDEKAKLGFDKDPTSQNNQMWWYIGGAVLLLALMRR